MKIFTISSSTTLAKKIVDKLNVPLGNLEMVKFGDTEVKPKIVEDVREQVCVVVASTSAPVNESYMELVLTVDALRRSAASRIVVVMPYMGYARQNQQHQPGEPVSAHVMVKIVEAVGVDEIITLDLHEEQVGGFYTIPLTHESAFPLLAKEIAPDIQGGSSRIVVVSPDQGGVERTRTFRNVFEDVVEALNLDLTVDPETAIVEKKRNLDMTHQTQVMQVSGASLKDAIAIIPDDVIVSGGTILNAANAAQEHGAKKVYLAATHADFIEGSVEKLSNSSIEKVYVADTIEIQPEWMFDKLRVVSVADMLAHILTNYVS